MRAVDRSAGLRPRRRRLAGPARRHAEGHRRGRFGADSFPGRRAVGAGGPLAAPSRAAFASATSTPIVERQSRRRRASSPRPTFRAATASASSRPSPTSRRWPKASRASAARRWRSSPASARRSPISTSAISRSTWTELPHAAAAMRGAARTARICIHENRAGNLLDQRASSSAATRKPRLPTAAVTVSGAIETSYRRACLYRARSRLGRDGRRHAGRHRLHAGALYGPRRHGEGARACRPKRCASCRPRPAAASAPSSTFRCSR